MDTKHLSILGFDSWFEPHLDNLTLSDCELARVVSVHRDSYKISKGRGEVFAELAGRFLFASDSPLELPTTGDWVAVQFYDDDSHAIIHELLPRKTLLKRKHAGRQVDVQLIASNIDEAFIIQSLNDDFNLRRLERYLVMVHQSEITPVVLLSKSDLMGESEIEQRTAQIHSLMPDIEVIPFSNENGHHIDAIINRLQAGKTYCMIGSSGVGKTTLLNKLLEDEYFDTAPIREDDSKGRHTTTARQLTPLNCGAIMIDTPGMRELGNFSVEHGLDETFSDVIELSRECRFSDCSHQNEKGCAIQSAIESGDLSRERYQNYLNLKKESDFYEMSYQEKRHKDKAFGKMVKNVMKGKKQQKDY